MFAVGSTTYNTEKRKGHLPRDFRFSVEKIDLFIDLLVSVMHCFDIDRKQMRTLPIGQDSEQENSSRFSLIYSSLNFRLNKADDTGETLFCLHWQSLKQL